jgi:type II secretory pathway component PulK
MTKIYRHPSHGLTDPRRGVVLLLVLVIIVVLTLAAYQFNELMTAEYKAADSAARAVQARALADAGVHYTAALLSNPDAVTSTLNGNPFQNPTAFQRILVKPNAQPRFQGRFSILSPLDPDEPALNGLPYRFGVSDEASKLNLNALMALDRTGKVAHDALMALPYMTEEVANAILDWIDADDQPRTNGAEDEYYQTLQPPYHCKNAPLDSLEELLLVRGVTPELVFGNDTNRNGTLDPGEDQGGGVHDRGWSAYLTVYSREQNIDSQNNPRIYVNSPDVKKTHDRLVAAVGDDMAYFMAAYRLYGPAADPAAAGQAQSPGARGAQPAANSAQPAAGSTQTDDTSTKPAANTAKPAASSSTDKKTDTKTTKDKDEPKDATRQDRDPLDFTRKPAKTIDSLYELINVKVNVAGRGGQTRRYASPLNDAGTLRATLPQVLDKTTTVRDSDLPARVNVNIAPALVLSALPGLTTDDVQRILDHRPNQSAGEAPDAIFSTPAWLITEANFSADAVRKLEKYVTTRSQVYRLQALGTFDRGGPAARVEAVIDTNGGRPRIIYWRDLSELGKGFVLQE